MILPIGRSSGSTVSFPVFGSAALLCHGGGGGGGRQRSAEVEAGSSCPHRPGSARGQTNPERMFVRRLSFVFAQRHNLCRVEGEFRGSSRICMQTTSLSLPSCPPTPPQPPLHGSSGSSHLPVALNHTTIK